MPMKLKRKNMFMKFKKIKVFMNQKITKKIMSLIKILKLIIQVIFQSIIIHFLSLIGITQKIIQKKLLKLAQNIIITKEIMYTFQLLSTKRKIKK